MRITADDLQYTRADMEREIEGALGSVISKYGIEDDLIRMCLLYPLPAECTDLTTFIECPPTVWIRDYIEMEDKYFYQEATVFGEDFSSSLRNIEKDFGLENHNIIPERILITQLAQASINCVVNKVNDMLAAKDSFITCLPHRKEWEKKALQLAVRDYLDRYTWGNNLWLVEDEGTLASEKPCVRIDVTDWGNIEQGGEAYPWLPDSEPDCPF